MQTALLYALHALVSSLGVVASRRIFDVGFGNPFLVNLLAQGIVFGSGTLLRRDVDERSRFDTRGAHALVGLATTLTHTLGHYPYKYLTVGFIQMLKSLTPVVIVFVLWVHGIERPDRARLVAVAGISVCACACSVGEGRFHGGGVALMLASSFADAYRLAWTQVLDDEHPIDLMTSTALWAAIFGLPFASFEVYAQPPRVTPSGVAWCLANGIVSCLVNLLTIRIVQRSGSTSLKLVGVLRNALLVLASAAWYGEWLPASATIAYIGLLAFMVLYVRAGTREGRCESVLPLQSRER